jgi:alpha 1,2-mannosyltransferase
MSNLGQTPFSRKASNVTDLDWVFRLISNNRPQLDHKLDQYPSGDKAKEKFATDDDFIFSREYLSNLLQLTEKDASHLKSKHTSFVKELKLDEHDTFGIEGHGKGIIFVGGIKFSWLALIGIEQLRLLGCSLPIEVFIGDENDYEEEFCNVILPKYNARCTVLYEEIPDISKLLPDVKISGYQYKNLAFLVSKFEKILFLDADNVPILDPTPIFDSKVFSDNGLVIWPDAWARTTHPRYYDIASINVSDKVVRGPLKGSKVSNVDTEVQFHDLENTLPNPSSESGMILVDKSKQTKTLLLSLYYNLFGPGLYYPLFTQGSAGEGDKETFIAAATVLKEKYYQVKQPLRFIGHHYQKEFSSKALGQADPALDYENYLKGSHLDEYNRLVKPNEATKDPNTMFMHLSYPKLVPFSLLNDNEIIKDNNQHIRMYGSATEIGGYDFELRIFQIITGALCENYNGYSPVSERLVGLKLKEYWGQDPANFCPQFIEHTLWLEQNPE